MSSEAKLQRALASETPEERAVVPLIPPADVGVKLNNIQGDIYPTFPKKYEAFIFFTIKDASAFRKYLGTFREESITTSDKTIEYLQRIQLVRRENIENNTKVLADVPNQFNIAFSHAAFQLMNIGNIHDQDFKHGMLKDAHGLGDIAGPQSKIGHYVPDWDEHWMDHDNPIHGVVVLASQDEANFKQGLEHVAQAFKDSIKINFTLDGKVRDGEMKGREFFGFLDGISQPALDGLVKPHTGQLTCKPGVIIHGIDGDRLKDKRPKWAVGGTVMAFRHLQQFVPEFNHFCNEHAIVKEGDKPGEAAERRGSRMFGRWKSGCPVDLHPQHDVPEVGRDPEQNNAFNFSNGRDLRNCPITSHIRKMAPRASRELSEDKLLPKPEDPVETNTVDRGLLFASYQSALNEGFTFIQKLWANDVLFPCRQDVRDDPSGHEITAPGFDPVIGANNIIPLTGRRRYAKGEDPEDLEARLELPHDFIKARGGEYFWAPSMDALKMIAEDQPMQSKEEEGDDA
ncbi:hypothetical protein FRB90_007400 [Tulasnella sp. 427]|nr:hypothetical protein FRB90_007400 [Tulasnella sp. 427]